MTAATAVTAKKKYKVRVQYTDRQEGTVVVEASNQKDAEDIVAKLIEARNLQVDWSPIDDAPSISLIDTTDTQ